MATMYPAKSGSPAALLTAAISDTDTSATFDTDVLTLAPGIATLGVGVLAEVVIFTGNTGTTISGMTRGASGTTARSWAAGTPIARRYTSYDHEAFRENIPSIEGTTSATLQLDTGNSGTKIKSDSGELQSRNSADDAYADFRALSYYGDGSNLSSVGAAAASALTMTATNKSGVLLPKGVVVYISGASGSKTTIDRADCTDHNKIRAIGITAEAIPNSGTGLVRVNGELAGIDTSGITNANPNGETWAAGDLVWLTSTGGMTNVRPTSGRGVKCAISLVGSDNNDTLLVLMMVNHVISTCASGEDILLRLGDNAGTNKLRLRDYANNEVAYIDSNGQSNIDIIGQTNLKTPIVKTAAYTAVPSDVILADTNTTGAFTITLPSTPSVGDIVVVYDAKGNFSTANLTVARNGSNIRGSASDLVLSTDWTKVELIYVDTTTGWTYV